MKTSSAQLYTTDLDLLRKYQAYPREPIREIVHRLLQRAEVKTK
jgi:hypothetical protein